MCIRHHGSALLRIAALLLVSACSDSTGPSSAKEWSRASEWTTYQGNAGHTGYVPVTLDTDKFRELWVAPVMAGAVLNPVTEGDGNVFVSTNAYFGKQFLAVLDIHTGTPQWSRDFGQVQSVHPPAYADGRVFLTTGGHEDSFLWAFDANTGTVLFRTTYANQWSRYFAPVVVEGAVYMAGGYYGGMYRFSATDGAQAWFAQTNQYDEWTPAVDKGMVYAYTGEYSPHLTVVDAATGSPAYSIPDPNFDWTGWSMDVAPVLGSLNNVLATQGGRLISFDLQNRRVGWEKMGSYVGNVTVANGVLYVHNNSQIEARRESDGSLLWVWVPPEGRPVGTTVVTKSTLFVSTAANTYAVDLASRNHAWVYPRAGHLALSKEGILLIAGRDGTLAAVGVR